MAGSMWEVGGRKAYQLALQLEQRWLAIEGFSNCERAYKRSRRTGCVSVPRSFGSGKQPYFVCVVAVSCPGAVCGGGAVDVC